MAEMAFLVMSEILGLSFNKFPGDDYSLRESENLPQPIQMKLPKKNIFSKYFAQVLKHTWNF